MSNNYFPRRIWGSWFCGWWQKVEYDEDRTKYLESQGYNVLRFWNNEVVKDIDTVIKVIMLELDSVLDGLQE